MADVDHLEVADKEMRYKSGQMLILLKEKKRKEFYESWVKFQKLQYPQLRSRRLIRLPFYGNEADGVSDLGTVRSSWF